MLGLVFLLQVNIPSTALVHVVAHAHRFRNDTAWKLGLIKFLVPNLLLRLAGIISASSVSSPSLGITPVAPVAATSVTFVVATSVHGVAGSALSLVARWSREHKAFIPYICPKGNLFTLDRPVPFSSSSSLPERMPEGKRDHEREQGRTTTKSPASTDPWTLGRPH